MNLSMKQKQNHGHRKQTVVVKGGGWVGRGLSGQLGLAGISFYT